MEIQVKTVAQLLLLTSNPASNGSRLFEWREKDSGRARPPFRASQIIAYYINPAELKAWFKDNTLDGLYNLWCINISGHQLLELIQEDKWK